LRHHSHADTSTAPRSYHRADWQVIKDLVPYLLAYKWRVVFALAFMILAKFANLGVPIVLKDMVNALDVNTMAGALWWCPWG